MHWLGGERDEEDDIRRGGERRDRQYLRTCSSVSASPAGATPAVRRVSGLGLSSDARWWLFHRMVAQMFQGSEACVRHP